MKNKILSLAFLIGLFSTSIGNAQISIEENKSLAQIQEQQGLRVDTANVSKVRAQVELNATIVATGMVCGFPPVETESLHNFFLMQFSKYNFTKQEAIDIANIHKEKVSQVILQKRNSIKPDECTRFRPEFEKIYNYAKESINTLGK